MRKIRDAWEAPRTHPVGVLLTHIPLLVFWIAFAVRDLVDGSVKVKGGGQVTLAADPLRFYVVAAVIVAVAVVVFIRIIQASLTLVERRNA